MQDLKKLVTIIADESPKVLPIIDPTDQTSLEGRLYHFIKNTQELTDEKACLYLYGEEKLTPSYRMLKSRLRKKLLNSLIFIELTESHGRAGGIKHAECFSLIHQAKKLLRLGEPLLAEKLADQVVVIAQKAEMNDMLAKAYEIKQNADLVSSNRGRFEKNLEMLRHYFLLDAKECEAIILHNKLKFELSLGVSNTRKQGVEFRETLLNLEKLWKETKSSKIYYYYHLISIGYCEVLGNFESILKAIEEADELLAAGSINKYWFNGHFYNYIKVYACLRLNRLDEGLHYAYLYLSTLKEGSYNWLAFLENYLLLSLHKRDYNLAAQLCKKAIEKGALQNPIHGSKEKWGLFLRYINLLSHKAQATDFNIPLPSVYETPLISKDKEGFNLPLLIVEYLERMPNLDMEDMEQYAARFSKYTSKYLNGETKLRARLFVKLLILSMKDGIGNLEEKGASLLQQLKNTPQPRDPFAEVEIVPYEHLWELVVAIADNRTYSN